MATGTILLPIPAVAADPTNPPGILWTTANRPYYAFNQSTDELVLWTFRLPENYASAPVLKVVWSGATSTTVTDTVFWRAEVMAMTADTDSVSIITDSFDTPNTASDDILGTTGARPQTVDLTLTNNDSMAAGDYVALRFGRDADNASDDLAEDAYLWALTLEYTTT